MTKIEKVNIKPNVSILSILKHIEYETWYALAEFVDNSLQSYLQNKNELNKLENEDFKLKVEIEINDEENKLIIRDNAAGISKSEFERAFRPAELPPDNSGLAEFGMGMKSAACWFSNYWNVRTKYFGEEFEKCVIFDINNIIEDKIEELEIIKLKSKKYYHYTVIELNDVTKIPRKKNLAKVKSHLASIYREFIRKKEISLLINNDILEFHEPKILYSTKYNDPQGELIYWKREIDFPIENNLSVKGFVGIREKASTSEAGLALFRRGRVIQGSFDDTFRPEYIFGNSNSFRFQRIFGELHLEGFQVNFTKKGVQWDNNLDMFLKLLRDDLSHKEFPLLQQADNYRARATDNEYKSARKALNETVDDFEKKAPQAVADVVNTASKDSEPEQQVLTPTEKTLHREFEIRFNKENWKISIELSYDPSLKEMFEVGDCFIKEKAKDESIRQIGIRLSLTHPFMIEFAGADTNKIEPILRIAAAFGLSEVIAKRSKIVGDVRRNFNELISNLSKQE